MPKKKKLNTISTPENVLDTSMYQNLIESQDNFFIWARKQRKYYYSKNIEKLTGYSLDSIQEINDEIFGIIEGEDYSRIIKEIRYLFDYPQNCHKEFVYRIIKKDGSLTWVKNTISIEFSGNEKDLCVYGIIQNINNYQSNETDLHKKIEELSTLVKTNAKFLNLVSHDLRSPFTSILGFTEILLNEPNTEIKNRTEYLSYIFNSSQHLLKLINNLLDISRIESGKMVPEIRRVNVKYLIYSAISNLTHNCISKNITVDSSIQDFIYVKSDEKLLTDIFMRLLDNAIKYSKEYSTIEISSKYFNEEYVEFVIKDSGVGINKKDKSKLFKQEEIFSTSGTAGERGTGLSLLLIEKIISKMNGKIWFYSQVDKGSEFHFVLQSSPNNILIINNDELERDSIAKSLQMSFPAVKINAVGDAYEAMYYTAKNFPTMIILEHNIPLMKGSTFINSMKSSKDSSNIKYIVLLDKKHHEFGNMYRDLGVSAILDKPYYINSLIKSIKKEMQ